MPDDLLTPRFAWGMALVASALWIISYIFVTCLNYAAARQVTVATYSLLVLTTPQPDR